MPPISHLLGMGERLRDRCRKFKGTITRHDFDGRVEAQPRRNGGLRPFGEQCNGSPLFEVNDDGTIPFSALPRPIIDADDA